MKLPFERGGWQVRGTKSEVLAVQQVPRTGFLDCKDCDFDVVLHHVLPFCMVQMYVDSTYICIGWSLNSQSSGGHFFETIVSFYMSGSDILPQLSASILFAYLYVY
jgi:hypothetical protein